MDSRFKIFTLWTDLKYQSISQEIYENYIANPDKKISTLDKIRFYKYITCTEYVCGSCKNSYTINIDFIRIARNPTLLFKGDVLICSTCVSLRSETPTFRRFCPVTCEIVNLPNYFWIYNAAYLYNVCYDYYTLIWDVDKKRDSYRDPKDMTLFDLIQKSINL